MSDLAGFLLARIADDEAIARRGAGPGAYARADSYNAVEECANMAESEGCSEDGVEYINHWLPNRTLAECEAKRRIVEEAFIVQAGSTEVVYVAPDGNQGRRRGLYPSALEMLKALAAVYADHPDFDATWGPRAAPAEADLAGARAFISVDTPESRRAYDEALEDGIAEDRRWDDDGGRQ